LKQGQFSNGLLCDYMFLSLNHWIQLATCWNPNQTQWHPACQHWNGLGVIAYIKQPWDGIMIIWYFALSSLWTQC
jgi:hypothetical protein